MTDHPYAVTMRPDGSTIQLIMVGPESQIREGEIMLIGRDGSLRRQLVPNDRQTSVVVAMLTPPMSEEAASDALSYAAQLVDVKQSGQATLLEPRVWAQLVIAELRSIISEPGLQAH